MAKKKKAPAKKPTRKAVQEKYVSERKIERRLENLLNKVLRKSGGHAETFDRAAVLGSNYGVVITLGNEQEFQLTIVESTR